MFETRTLTEPARPGLAVTSALSVARASIGESRAVARTGLRITKAA